MITITFELGLRNHTSPATQSSINSFPRFCSMSQQAPPPRPMNDSGCLLGDTDLFDTGLDGDSGDEEEEEQEESLDAIRAAVRQKVKKHKVTHVM